MWTRSVTLIGKEKKAQMNLKPWKTIKAAGLALVIGVVAASSGQALGGGYLIRNAALVLTMDPSLGDGSSSDSSRTPTYS